jgi:penicillin-insensitive murein endopeptidase
MLASMWRAKLALFLALAVSSGLAVASARAQATVAPDESQALMRTATYANPPAAEQRRNFSRSVSIGSTNRGRLDSGVRLSESTTLRIKPGSENARWGTAEMIGMIERAAARVSLTYPGARLSVGDVSRRGGGRLHPHLSHRAGRDADIGFYLKDADGRPVELRSFVDIAADGCGEFQEVRYCFDEERNWTLVASIVDDPLATVQYILIAPYLRDRLLATGERLGAPPELVAKVALATERHRGSSAHRNHFHVRLYCSVDDRPECFDMPPFHSWYEGQPSTDDRAERRRARPRQRGQLRRRSRPRG